MKYAHAFLVLLLCSTALADAETDAAIDSVQKDLANPQTRAAAVNSSKEAQEQDRQVQSVAGSATNQDEIYKMSADILGNMKGMSMDDINKVLQQAQTNPEAFAKTWTPEQLKQLNELAAKVSQH